MQAPEGSLAPSLPSGPWAKRHLWRVGLWPPPAFVPEACLGD